MQKDDLTDPFAEYAEDVVLTADQDNQFPVGSAEAVTKREAGKATTKTKIALTAIEQITNRIRENHETHVVVLQPEPYHEVLGKEEFWEDLTACMKIVNDYRLKGYEANNATVDDDVMRLAAHLVHISTINAYLMGIALQANSSRKITYSRFFVAAKKARQELQLPLTDQEAHNMARDETRQYYDDEHRLDVVARTITGAYFAIQKFMDLLDRIASRQQRTERNAAS